MRHALLFALLLSLSGLAQAEEPSIAYIFPAGGQRGQVVKFHVGGHNLLGEAVFRMTGPGVAASPKVREVETLWFEGPVIPLPDSQRKEDYPKDHAGEVKIAADAPLGTRFWNVATSQGTTPSMRFVVGDLPEVVEQEIDGAAIPVEVKLPVTINGRIFPREDVDVWTFHARRGQAIHCEVCAARLGSGLDSRLEVLGPRGRRLAENVDHFGADSFVQFTAPADGQYQVRIHDINFGGLQHYVYRLTISAAPRVDHVFPLGGRRGTSVSLQLAGANMPAKPVSVELPADGPQDFAWRPTFNGAAANPVWLDLDDLPELLEREPNNSREAAQPGQTPAVLNGRIDAPGDVDVWSFASKKGDEYEFELRASRLGSPLDGQLFVFDENGRQLAKADDNAGADPVLRFKAPADATYFVQVEERFASRGGPRFAYRLRIGQAPPPGFRITLPADAVNVARGAEVKLKLNLERLGGFSRPITLHFEGLPSGVTADDVVVPGKKTNAQVILKADATAAIGEAEVILLGKAEVGEEKRPLSVAAVFPTRRGEPEISTLRLGVAVPTPFTFHGTFLSSYAGQGVTHTRRYKIERNGYEGPLTVRLADRQARHLQGVAGPTIVVPPEADSFDYTVQLPPWLDVGRTSRTTLMAIGEVTDKSGRRHKVSYSSVAPAEQIIVLADPGPLSVKADRASILARPGQTVEVGVRVQRAKAIHWPVTLSLVTADHVRGVTAEPVVVAPDEQDATVKLHFDRDCGPFNMPLVIRGVAQQGDQRVLAQAEIEVVPAKREESGRAQTR